MSSAFSICSEDIDNDLAKTGPIWPWNCLISSYKVISYHLLLLKVGPPSLDVGMLKQGASACGYLFF
ncbi:unnamed protein product [Thlaspi arvense]|uniref:Uncharacterized protein n=1 Tax=Thlaspi arvense TaxID=13288 RepID=A0AAU9SPL8_THLAR|nr:unnamed protein product [Thlaspi arvense]